MQKISLPLPPAPSPEGVSIAAGGIILALLDILRRKNFLDDAEIAEILHSARAGIGARRNNPGAIEAEAVIRAVGDHFAKRNT